MLIIDIESAWDELQIEKKMLQIVEWLTKHLKVLL